MSPPGIPPSVPRPALTPTPAPTPKVGPAKKADSTAPPSPPSSAVPDSSPKDSYAQAKETSTPAETPRANKTREHSAKDFKAGLHKGRGRQTPTPTPAPTPTAGPTPPPVRQNAQDTANPDPWCRSGDTASQSPTPEHQTQPTPKSTKTPPATPTPSSGSEALKAAGQVALGVGAVVAGAAVAVAGALAAIGVVGAGTVKAVEGLSSIVAGGAAGATSTSPAPRGPESMTPPSGTEPTGGETQPPAVSPGERASQKAGVNLQPRMPGGAGGHWPVIDQVRDSTIPQQANPVGCGHACVEMVLKDRGIDVSQQTVSQLLGDRPTLEQSLVKALTEFDTDKSRLWKGASVDPEHPASLKILNKSGSWVAQMWDGPGSKMGHWVAVEGIDKEGRILIKDPWDGTRYKMTEADFRNAWTGFSVWSEKR